MPRFGLTIQRKFLLLILLVGLFPAVLGVVMSTVIGRLSFARASGISLQARAQEIASRLGDWGLSRALTFQSLIALRGDDIDQIQHDLESLGEPDSPEFLESLESLGAVELMVVLYPDDTLDIRPLKSAFLTRNDLLEELENYAADFAKYRQANMIPGATQFGEFILDRGGREPELHFVVLGYLMPNRNLLFFLARGDTILSDIELPIGVALSDVFIYTGGTTDLTSSADPLGILSHARERFSETITAVPDWFNIWEREGGRIRWNVVGHAVIPGLMSLAEQGRAPSPWVVLVTHDMETFLDLQGPYVWFSVFAALGWALVLMGISVVAALRVVGPVKALRKQVEVIAAGNLDVRASVNTHDEIQDLAEAFNTMSVKLGESYRAARRFAEELEHKVEERTRDLALANRKLVQTEKHAAMGRLAANLAHEINNPLSIIKNYMSLLTKRLTRIPAEETQSELTLEHLRIINEEIDRIARIVRQLLDLHRPPEQKVQRTDIGALLSDIIALMESDLRDDKISVRCELEPDLPKPLVSPDLMRQVFINLLRNAQDAMQEGGELTVKSESRNQVNMPTGIWVDEQGREVAPDEVGHSKNVRFVWDQEEGQPVVAISISDTGSGIEPEHLRQIFDPFFTTKPPDRGTGLGLSVSYGIVQMYAGSIEVRSEPNKGTTMIVTLPVDPPKSVQQGPGEDPGGEKSRSAGPPASVSPVLG